MITAAFYAPLKPPDDPVPSGDRTMARSLQAALHKSGINTVLASRFRSRDPSGELDVQKSKTSAAEVEIRKIIDGNMSRKWHFWLTYHNYYKAPDLIGPAVSAALGIPYLLIESTRARKRIGGLWDTYAHAAETASDAADGIFYFTQHDAEALLAYAPATQRLIHLPPFLPTEVLPPASHCPRTLLTVGMFRSGDKLASYELVAQTLKLVSAPDWHLTIVGDGPERPKVERLMSVFGDRVSFLGALSGNALNDAYQEAGVFLWPGVNEAFGMVYLEAQAAGVPVIAQDRPGVRDVLAPVLPRPTVEAGPGALAAQIDHLLGNDAVRREAGQKSRHFVADKHLIDHASMTLGSTIRDILA